jgi:hypothetical protein
MSDSTPPAIEIVDESAIVRLARGLTEEEKVAGRAAHFTKPIRLTSGQTRSANIYRERI